MDDLELRIIVLLKSCNALDKEIMALFNLLAGWSALTDLELARQYVIEVEKVNQRMAPSQGGRIVASPPIEY